MTDISEKFETETSVAEVATHIERQFVVRFLRQQAEKGGDIGRASEKGSTRRAAYGGGALALTRAADAIQAGEHGNPLCPADTAGPEEADVDSGSITSEGHQVASAWVPQHRDNAIPEQKANAYLMAAAPDLLEACEEFVRKVESGEARSTKSYAQMKAAIAKAKGSGQ